MNSDESPWGESDFPDLHLNDLAHLQRQYNIHGKKRVVGWLRAKVAVPLSVSYSEDFDEDAFYEAFAEHVVDMGDGE